MARGSLSTGVKSSIVERAGLVKMLMATSQKTINSGSTHLNISPGFARSVKATAIKTIAAKLIPVEMMGNR